MKTEQAAEVVRVVDGLLADNRTQLLDALIARLVEPSQLGWHDATKEAPPDDVRVLAVNSDEVVFATYDRAASRDKWGAERLLPHDQFAGRWTVEHRSGNVTEGTYFIRWWMPLPLVPR